MESVCETVRRQAVDRAAGRLILRLVRLCNWSKERLNLVGKINTTVFLGMYQMLCDPKDFFTSLDEQEDALLASCRVLHGVVHTLVAELGGGTPWPRTSVYGGVPGALFDYLMSFQVGNVGPQRVGLAVPDPPPPAAGLEAGGQPEAQGQAGEGP